MTRTAASSCLWFLLAAGASHAQLANPSFEQAGTSGQLFADWQQFGPVSASTSLATDGTTSARISTRGNGGAALSGVYQDIPITPGQHVRYTVKSGFTGAAPVGGDTRGVVNVEWRNASGDLISFDSETSSMSADTPGDSYTLERIVGPAPAGATTARLLLGVFETGNQSSGSVHYDEAQMFPVPPPTHDDIEWNDYGTRTIEWSGYTWRLVRGGVQAPGDNYWSNSEDAAWVDDQGRLHLKIDHIDGQWYSVGMAMTEPLGFGDYRFGVVGEINDIDINTVLGIFTWEYLLDYSGVGPNSDNLTNEFDIEFSRWKQPLNDPAQFVAQPYQQGQISRFDFEPRAVDAITTHAFDWSDGEMDCRSWHGDAAAPIPEDLIHTWNYQGGLAPEPGQTKILINHWMIGEPPSDGQPQEVILSSFTHVPACPADVNFDQQVSPADFTAWLACFNNPEARSDCFRADVNLDGSITPADFTAWLSAFNAGCG